MISEIEILKIKENVDIFCKKTIKYTFFSMSIRYIGFSSRINYYFNLRYRDDALEDMAFKLVKKIKLVRQTNKVSNNIIFFYDLYGWAKRGLTYQYLENLSEFREIYYIFDREDKVVEDDLLNLLSIKNIQLIDLSNIKNLKSKMKKIANISNNAYPEKIFIHNTPSSIVPFSLKAVYPNSTISLVNITDHSFWLGSSVVDHVLEFRDYGAYITSTSRNIKLENIFKIPFYPVIPEVTESEFPRVLNKSKINIFTGGDLSKIVIKNDFFLNLLVDIVSRYESVNIVIAGGGDSSKLMNFIQSNKVSDKIHYIGFRQDLPEIMSNIDIYLSTYPIGGGLMNAYALHFKKPIISFVDIELTHTFIENSFDIPEKISYSSKEGFFDELDKLVLNKKYREDKGLRFCGYLTSRESFCLRLNNYLNGRLESLTAPKPFNTSLERSKKNVIDAENAGLGSFSKIFFRVGRL